MNQGLVNVIVPVYNGERYLGDSLRSIFAQDYRPLQVIVVDDGSTDGSAAIAQSFAGVEYHHQANQGVADAWNAGIQRAKGEFVTFMSQDDLWEPKKVRLQVEYLSRHPDDQFVLAKARFFLQVGREEPVGFRPGLMEREHVAWIMEALMARRSAFETIGMLDRDAMPMSDVDWFARAKDSGAAMGIVPDVLVYRRIHDQNWSFQDIEEKSLGLLPVLRRSIRRQRAEEGTQGDLDAAA